MSPLEHALVALIAVTIYLLLRRRRLPSKMMLSVVCFGSVFPDLVDKPVSYANLTPWGRVFMHSLPFAIPVIALVLGYALMTNRLHLGAGFSVGYLLHLPGDWHKRLLSGEIPPDLLWPLTSIPAHPGPAHWWGPENVNIIWWSLFSAVILGIVAIRMGRDISSHMNYSFS
jgi:Predicted membrane-bound metal-dependent hydrolase (DUF457).